MKFPSGVDIVKQVLQSAFRYVFFTNCRAEACHVDLALGKKLGVSPREISPLLSGSHVEGAGSARLGGCQCAT